MCRNIQCLPSVVVLAKECSAQKISTRQHPMVVQQDLPNLELAAVEQCPNTSTFPPSHLPILSLCFMDLALRSSSIRASKSFQSGIEVMARKLPKLQRRRGKVWVLESWWMKGFAIYIMMGNSIPIFYPHDGNDHPPLDEFGGFRNSKTFSDGSWMSERWPHWFVVRSRRKHKPISVPSSAVSGVGFPVLPVAACCSCMIFFLQRWWWMTPLLMKFQNLRLVYQEWIDAEYTAPVAIDTRHIDMFLQGSHCRSKPNPAPLKEKRQRVLSKSLNKAVEFKRVTFWYFLSDLVDKGSVLRCRLGRWNDNNADNSWQYLTVY